MVSPSSIHEFEDNETNLRSDEFQTRELPPCLLVDDIFDLGVDLRERLVEHLILEESE